jgi:hypothetical protein
MNKTLKHFLYWTPRVICILFALFLSIFALDVFSENYSFGETIIALIMHLIPTGIIVLILIVAWRREWVGSILFIALAIFYPIWVWGRFPLITYFSISGPLLLIGLLFMVNWKYRTELHK